MFATSAASAPAPGPSTSFLRDFSVTPSGHFAPSSIHFFKTSVSSFASRSSVPVTLFFGGINLRA